MTDEKEPNQGEGDRESARRYDEHVREHVEEGKVPAAAADARAFVDAHPDEAKDAEQEAKRGPTRTSLFDRMGRALGRLRTRARKAP